MGLFWNTRKSGCDCSHSTARLGALVIRVDDYDGDNQPYAVLLETKVEVFGKRVPQQQTVFSCDPFFGGLQQAKERASYIARCLHYGLPIKFTDHELRSGKFTPVPGMLQKPPTTTIRDVWVRGIYLLPASGEHFRIEYVSNIDQVTGLNGRRISLSQPSIVLKEIHTDHVFSVTLDEFKKFGFQHVEGIDHATKVFQKT